MERVRVLKKSGLIFFLLFIWIAGFVAFGLMAVAYQQLQVPASMGATKQIFVDFWDKGYVSAQGSWVGKDLSPLQVSEIKCSRTEKECYEAQAVLQKSFLGGGHFMSVVLERYDITRWDDEFITYEDHYPCTHYRYTIDRKNIALNGLRSLNKDPSAACNNVDAHSPEYIELSLSDSFTPYWEEAQKATRTTAPFFILASFVWTAFLARWGYKRFKRL